MSHRFLRWAVVVLVMSMGVAGLLPSDAEARRATATVMTRNLYLGADLTPLITSPDITTAAADIYLNVIATDFEARVELIADEILQTSPDLVGLQEVSLWRTGAFLSPDPAETVAFDFLTLLEAELGGQYVTAVVFEGFDAEAPAGLSSPSLDPPAPPVPVLRDVRLTQRNVILVKEGVEYSNVQSGAFETNFTYEDVGGIPGNDLTDLRGWVSVDVSVDGRRPFRFLNTHLESFVAPVRTVQAEELVAGPLSTNLKVVAVGDFNSPPAGPESGAYQVLTSRSDGKLTDTWAAANPGNPGFTCCQDATLLNDDSEADTRIDLILTRTNAVKTMDAIIVGDVDRTPSGLWASDHFGVVADLAIP